MTNASPALTAVVLPAFNMVDINGKPFNLGDFKGKKVFVNLWASWCPHCMEELPKLNEWAVVNPKTKVVAISLDDDKTAYETTIQKFPALIHDTDLKKWEGKAVTDYFVYGTPTFIVLDKDKNIVDKYSDFKSIEKSTSKL